LQVRRKGRPIITVGRRAGPLTTARVMRFAPYQSSSSRSSDNTPIIYDSWLQVRQFRQIIVRQFSKIPGNRSARAAGNLSACWPAGVRLSSSINGGAKYAMVDATRIVNQESLPRRSRPSHPVVAMSDVFRRQAQADSARSSWAGISSCTACGWLGEANEQI
jgi:hypothetical protein